MRLLSALCFCPLHLNVDTDLQPFASFSANAFLGFVFLALLLTAAWLTARRRVLRPISFWIALVSHRVFADFGLSSL